MSAAENLVEVKTQRRVYLRDYVETIAFDRKELGLNLDSWPWKLLMELAEESEHERAQSSKVRSSRAILRWIREEPVLSKFCLLQPHEVNPRTLREFLNISETLAAASENRSHIRNLPAFRFLVFHTGSKVFIGDFSRGRVGFKSKVLYKAKPRPLLSDGTDALSLSTGSPLGAIPFEKFSDFQEQHKRKVASDLDRIRNACITELEHGAKARKKLLDLGSSRPDKRILEIVKDLAPDHKHMARTLRRAKATPEEVLHAVAFEISRGELYKSNAPAHQVPFSREVIKVLFAPAEPFLSQRVLEMGYRATGEEMFAATLLLQTYCGWNYTSLISLPVDGLRFTGSLVEISGGFKRKTDDDAPPFALERSAPGINQAVELVLWNREQLIQQGHLPATRKELLVYGVRASYGAPHPVGRLKNLIAKYQLPPFSLDQVRTQVLYQMGLQGGVELARRVGGHNNLATTGNYLHQLAAQRLHSSSNLEFQKRLERELLYAIGPKKSNRKLLALIRVGDGASCIDPKQPPPGRSENPSECGGTQCHTNGGCPHRKIIIDLDRMEDTLRMKTHYEKRHHVMRDENPDHFEKFVLPGIMFNEALHQILLRGPHASSYAKVARRLENGDDSIC